MRYCGIFSLLDYFNELTFVKRFFICLCPIKQAPLIATISVQSSTFAITALYRSLHLCCCTISIEREEDRERRKISASVVFVFICPLRALHLLLGLALPLPCIYLHERATLGLEEKNNEGQRRFKSQRSGCLCFADTKESNFRGGF